MRIASWRGRIRRARSQGDSGFFNSSYGEQGPRSSLGSVRDHKRGKPSLDENPRTTGACVLYFFPVGTTSALRPAQARGGATRHDHTVSGLTDSPSRAWPFRYRAAGAAMASQRKPKNPEARACTRAFTLLECWFANRRSPRLGSDVILGSQVGLFPRQSRGEHVTLGQHHHHRALRMGEREVKPAHPWLQLTDETDGRAVLFGANDELNRGLPCSGIELVHLPEMPPERQRTLASTSGRRRRPRSRPDRPAHGSQSPGVNFSLRRNANPTDLAKTWATRPPKSLAPIMRSLVYLDAQEADASKQHSQGQRYR